MKRTFRPNLENLEDRLVMSTATEELYGNFHLSLAAAIREQGMARPEMSLTKSAADINTTSEQRYSGIAFVGGWGSSSYQYAFVGADGASLHQALVANEQVSKHRPSDDVWIDGKIITGENPAAVVGGSIPVYWHVIRNTASANAASGAGLGAGKVNVGDMWKAEY